MTKKVRLFSAKSCPFCFLVEEFLKDKKIAFEKVMVDQDQKMADYIVKRSGQRALPVTEVDGKVIVGYNKEELGKVLGIIV
ncbi:glutathione S-transferase N-terminal domain-containing protein [Candidatus Woesearchaeota archaeon]|nr:glutathione S-transferase N-terminal domain-containing protein [Candidatus Woesearchaeota archaeon]